MRLPHIFKQRLRRLSISWEGLVTSSSDRPRAQLGLCSRGTVVFLMTMVLAVSACREEMDTGRSEHGEPSNERGAWDLVVTDPEAEWLPVLATQDLAVGIRRIAFSLDGLGGDDEPPTIRVSLYALDEDRESPRSVQYARFLPYERGIGITAHGHANASVSDRSLPIGLGVYVVPVQLTSAGLWGVHLELSAGERDGAMDEVRLRFSVRERQAAPSVGQRAPSVDSRTRDDVESLSALTSDVDPEPGLYAMSISEALNSARPSIIAFATPAFCHSRTCAPVLDAVKSVWREFSAEVNGIHVEVFENPHEPSRLVEAEAFVVWRLPSEPWVFVVDADGVIRYAFEGAVTEAELRSAVEWVVQDRQ